MSSSFGVENHHFPNHARSKMQDIEEVMASFSNITLKLQQNNYELSNMKSKLDNLDNYHQHLTSVSIRCDLLDEQVKNLERKESTPISATDNNGIKEFRDWKNHSFDWMATKTTLENLKLEFEYLNSQYIQNSHYPQIDIYSAIRTNNSSKNNKTTNSLFSCDGTQYTEDSMLENSNNILPDLVRVQSKKKVLKKESFLNISNQPLNANPNQTQSCFTALPIKKFKICNNKSKPTTKTSIPDLKVESEQTQRFGPSLLTNKSKYQHINMPLIEEEISPKVEPIPIQRRSSLPETVSFLTMETPDAQSHLNSTGEESLKHFISYDIGLHTKLLNDRISLFEKSQFLSSNKHQAITKMISSSPLDRFANNEMSNNFDLTAGFDDLEELNISDDDDETLSENSYGDENVQPFVLKKPSQLFLRRSKSHESIFSMKTNKINNKDKIINSSTDTKLKEQTMKWLKPNIPSVSSQTYTASTMNTVSVNAHDDIVNILNSGALSTITESPAKILEKHRTPQNIKSNTSSWSNFLSTPSKSKPININQKFNKNNHTVENMNHVSNSEHGSSWISSLIPNTAYAIPETGKVIGTPCGKSYNPRHQLTQKLNSNEFRTMKSSSYHKRNISSNRLNSSSMQSGLIIEKHSLIKHGNGDLNNSVVMSRVSHGALREALEFNMTDT